MYSLFDIEKKYKSELENIEEWAYLRSYYRQAISYGGDKVRKISKLDSIKNMFYGFSSWFRRYKYFIFSDTSERRVVDGKLFDKSVDYIINTLDKNNSLLIEEPSPSKHFLQDDISTKNITSRRILDLLALILEKIIFKKYFYKTLDKINQDYNINMNYTIQINRFNARYILYKFILKLYKVELIIINCYYSKQYILKAAHDLNIKTIEVQHGVIGKENDAYRSNIKLNTKYFPQCLLSFGENEISILKDKGVITKQVISVGSFYLEYLLNTFTINKDLNHTIKDYKYSIGVSLQKGSEELVLDFINKVSKEDDSILYIIIPRVFNKKLYDKYNFSNNIIFFPSLDCYQIVMHCDYHCTFYSACAIETPTLNIPNILLNFNDDAKKYYDIIDGKTSKTVNNTQEFLNILYTNYFENIDIMKNNSIFIKNNYKENIKQLKKDSIFDTN